MAVEPPHDFQLQDEGVASHDLFIDIRTACPQNIDVDIKINPSSRFLGKDTKICKHSLLGPFHFCAARKRAT